MSKSKANPQQATVYHLSSEHDGLTLAAALKAVTPDASWGEVKKWIRGRQIQVNGNLCLDDARRVSDKDVVKRWSEPREKPVEAGDLRIVHLDEWLLVVEKPAGITSVRHVQERRISTKRRQLQPTLEELLPRVLARVQKLRWPPLPPKGMNRGRNNTNFARGRQSSKQVHNAKKLPPELQVFPVHRLDRDTSGLMLFARQRLAEQRLVSMFRRHTIQRQYVAFCHGNVEEQRFESWLVRDRGDGKRGSILDEDRQRLEAGDQQDTPPTHHAVTHIVASKMITESPSPVCKVRCKLETGRTHQIRIHLSESGHPLCGDKIYGQDDQPTLPVQAPRQALHSDRLEFTHPFTGEHLRFQMALPKDLKSWLARLQPSG